MIIYLQIKFNWYWRYERLQIPITYIFEEAEDANFALNEGASDAGVAEQIESVLDIAIAASQDQ